MGYHQDRKRLPPAYWGTRDGTLSFSGDGGMLLYYNSSHRVLPPGVTMTRAADDSYTQGTDGLWVPASANTDRYGSGKLLIEPAITQLLNNDNTGASVGTLPTYWDTFVPAALSNVVISVVALGDVDDELGIPYIDINFLGTPSSTGIMYIFPNGTLCSPVDRLNDYAFSYYPKVIAGSYPADSILGSATQEFSDPTTIIPGTLASDGVTAGAPTTSYVRRVFVVNPANVACTHLRVAFRLIINSTDLMSVTIRFAGPMLEKASAASSPVINGTTAGIRNADVVDFSTSSRYSATNRTVIVNGAGTASTTANWDGSLSVGQYRSVSVYKV